jgi:hypothetical protein
MGCAIDSILAFSCVNPLKTKQISTKVVEQALRPQLDNTMCDASPLSVLGGTGVKLVCVSVGPCVVLSP